MFFDVRNARAFFARHRWGCVAIIVIGFLFLGANSTAITALTGTVAPYQPLVRAVPLRLWLWIVFSVVALYMVYTYSVWTVQYRYFYMLHRVILRHLHGARQVVVRSSLATYCIQKHSFGYTLSVHSNGADTRTLSTATVGEDYFDEIVYSVTGDTLHTYHLGPLRNIPDTSQVLRRWCRELHAAQRLNPSTTPLK